MSDEDNWDNSDVIKKRQERNRKKYTNSGDETIIREAKQKIQMDIRDKSISPTEDIMEQFPEEVEVELKEHENNIRDGRVVSAMIQIPLPNKSRKQPNFPYEKKPSQYTRRIGGVKKRKMTKRRKNKRKKTKKRRVNKKRKTRKSNKKR
jgi:hypothetical protein